MTMRKTVKNPWRVGLLLAGAPGFVVAFSSGCTPKTVPSDVSDGQVVADGEAATAAPDPVDPPAPVVAQDPQIPLNEAVVGSAPVAEDFYAASAPPEPVVEAPPPSPAPTNVWIPGYWWWSLPLARYVWVGGAWRNPPPEQTWFPGSWGLVSPGRYGWTPGLWAPRGYVRDTVVINVGPPVLRVETYGAAPGAEFVWRPGYYGFHSGSYAWVAGTWDRPPVIGLGWVEPRYVGVWGHYYFQPGRWDFAAERRGTVYLPDINVRPGERYTAVAAPVAVVSAHLGYVSACARAIGRGAVRTASGGYVPPAAGAHVGVGGHAGAAVEGHGGAESHHGGAEEHPGGAVEAHGGGAEVHGGPEVHAAPEVHGGPEVHPGPEVHGGAEVHPGPEVHGGAEVHSGGPAQVHGGAEEHPVPPVPAKPAAAPAAQLRPVAPAKPAAPAPSPKKPKPK